MNPVFSLGLSFEDLDSTSSSCRCTVVTSPHRILSLFFSFSSHFAATIYHLPAGKIPPMAMGAQMKEMMMMM